MSSIVNALIVFGFMLASAMLGVFLRSVLPKDHMSPESKEAVRLGIGLVATMSAMVLGLLVSSAKSFYDAQNAELTQMSSKVVLLDRILAHYGPETKEARDVLRVAVVDNLDRLWPRERARTAELEPPDAWALVDMIQALSPTDDRQRSLHAQALSMAIGIGQTRWLMYEQRSSVSKPMLVIVVFWLGTIFLSVGLFAPSNATVIASFVVSTLSVSGAILLILDLYEPFRGVIQISSVSLRSALAHLGH